MGRLARGLARLLRRRVRAGSGAAPRGPGAGGGPDAGGGAGVREPRRPHPAAPSTSAHAEPVPDQYLDLEVRRSPG